MFLRHLELFSGVGGFRQALELLSCDFNIKQKTIGFSEIDKYAVKTYKARFVGSEKELGDIVEFNKKTANIIGLENFDLLTGGFPCQPFSMMGAQKGFKDCRGGLFFEIIKIIKIKKPKFVLLENVKNLITHNHGKTMASIVKELEECGYRVYYDVFDTNDFGLAQKRNRVYIFATTEKNNDLLFKAEIIKKIFEQSISNKSSLLIQKNTHQILSKTVDEKYYLSSKIKPTILSNGSKSYVARSSINPLVARPLTATMVKLHRACQDNYFSDGFILSKDPNEYIKTHFSTDELLKQRIRKITPREAFILQGFDDEYVSKAFSSGNSDFQLYKQAGNAVSVNVVYSILYYIFIICKVGNDYVL